MTVQQPIDVETLLSEGASLPHYATVGAAGADLYAYLKQDVTISPGKSAMIPTGIKVAIPVGYEIQIRPRSGLALKEQITVLNTPGTIDSDYRGDVAVILINHGMKDFVVTQGMRIAQMVLAQVCHAHFVISSELSVTDRLAKGFGHTGLH